MQSVKVGQLQAKEAGLERDATNLEREHEVLEERALLSLEQSHKVIDSEIRLSHGVGLSSESVLDVGLSASPGLFPVEEDGLLEAAARESFLGEEGDAPPVEGQIRKARRGAREKED